MFVHMDITQAKQEAKERGYHQRILAENPETPKQLLTPWPSCKDLIGKGWKVGDQRTIGIFQAFQQGVREAAEDILSDKAATDLDQIEADIKALDSTVIEIEATK